MSSSFRLLVAALCCLSHASGFGGVADSFHLLHDAASSFAHHATVAHHTSLVHHASHQSHLQAADLLNAYKHLLTSHPLPTKMATGATLAVAGDAIAQSREPAEYDKSRASSFAVFDTAYRAVQHYAFPFIVKHCHGQFLAGALASAAPLLHHHQEHHSNLLLPLLHHQHEAAAALVDQSYLAAMEQTLASQLGIVPFFYYPVFFALTAAVQGLDFDSGMIRAKENFLPLMKRNLLFWIPVQFVQFAFVAEDLQIPFLSACGLAWTFILSVSAGAAKKTQNDEEISNLIDEMMDNEQVISNEALPPVEEALPVPVR